MAFETELKLIEKRIKEKGKYARTDIQSALDALRGKQLSLDVKRIALYDMITRTGIKRTGIRTVANPRIGLEEVDKTFEFLNDLKSYEGWDK